MAYTRVWSDVTPPGSQAANLIDDEIRNLRVDIHDRLNSMVPDWTSDPIQRFGCRVSPNANQSINNATNTALACNAESFDVGNLHDTAVNNSRVTIPANGNKGIWRFHAIVQWAANAVGIRLMQVLKNGATILVQTDAFPPGANQFYQEVDILVNTPLVGDFFEIIVFQTSGGALNVEQGAGNSASYFEALYLL